MESGIARVVYDDPIEKEMIDVVNLKPGESVDFLFYRVYFYDLMKHTFPQSDPKYPEKNFLSGISELCRWSIDEQYFNKSLKNAEYAIVAICSDDNYSGIKTLILARRDFQDPNGVYLDLMCNADLAAETDKAEKGYINLRIRTAQLLMLTMFNYSREYLKATHAYNAAATTDLVSFYGRNGWVPRTRDCSKDDELAREFATLDYGDIDEFVKKMESQRRIKKDTSGSYPMKLCNYNFNNMFSELLIHTHDILKYLDQFDIDLNDFCNFA